MADDAIYVITHVDLIPPHAEAGKALLEAYAKQNATKDGVIRVELLQQFYRKNHFEFLTVFSSMEAYESNLAAEHTIEFRTQLHPMLGAPFDDRVHVLDTD